jgi:hypothetical protein
MTAHSIHLAQTKLLPKIWQTAVERFQRECVRQLPRIPVLLMIFMLPQTVSFRTLSSRSNARRMAA